jgi:hypothetical protein
MIKVITNDQGSGDWITIKQGDQYLFEGHSIRPFDLENLLRSLGHTVEFISVTDKEMEEGVF